MTYHRDTLPVPAGAARAMGTAAKNRREARCLAV